MTILEAENQNLRQRIHELEMEFRSFKEMHARILKENEQLKGRIAVLETQVQGVTLNHTIFAGEEC